MAICDGHMQRCVAVRICFVRLSPRCSERSFMQLGIMDPISEHMDTSHVTH